MEIKHFIGSNGEKSLNFPLKWYSGVSVKIKTTYSRLSNVGVEHPCFWNSGRCNLAPKNLPKHWTRCPSVLQQTQALIKSAMSIQFPKSQICWTSDSMSIPRLNNRTSSPTTWWIPQIYSPRTPVQVCRSQGWLTTVSMDLHVPGIFHGSTIRFLWYLCFQTGSECF